MLFFFIEYSFRSGSGYISMQIQIEGKM